jgi:hypothetical protein
VPTPGCSWSQSQSYVTTDGQSASLSWCEAPIWGPRLDFYYCQTVACLLMWSALSDERMGLSFTIAAGPRLAQSFSSPSPTGPTTKFCCLRFEIPPTWGDRSLCLYPPGTGWPSYNPMHWVPFSSSPTTHRATVEVFEPTSTRGLQLVKSQSCFTTGCLPPIGSSGRQVHWDSRPEIFFFNRTLAVIDLM